MAGTLLGALAQPARKARIAILSGAPLADMVGSDPASPNMRALVHGLRDLGWVEGRNLTIFHRSVEGRLYISPFLLEETAAYGPDVIVVYGPGLFRAAQAATRSIPIVSVGGGLALSAANPARPGGNFTGLVTDSSLPALNGKRLELLKEAAPRVSRVVAIRPALQPGRPLWVPETEEATRKLGLTLSIAWVDRSEDFDAAFDAIRRERPHAMLILDTPVNVGGASRIVDFAGREQLPTVYAIRHFVDAGGLLSYGADYADLSRRAAQYVDKILKGARPGDLPIEQPARFELAIHLGAARALGLTLRQSLMLRADAVIG